MSLEKNLNRVAYTDLRRRAKMLQERLDDQGKLIYLIRDMIDIIDCIDRAVRELEKQKPKRRLGER